MEAALVIPNIVDKTGTVLPSGGYTLRCFPPNNYQGKERKFLRTKGAPYRPYIPPNVGETTSKLEVPIFIVEKQVAALLLDQLGRYAIALGGTWGAGQPQTAEEKAKGEKRILHRALAEFSWIGREVYLCFDSDFTQRESVLEGLIRTFILFTTAGASAKVLLWDSEYKGLDDYVAYHAGLDIEKQKEVVANLLDPLMKMDVKEAAAKWIRPGYRPLFEREGCLVSMSTPAKNSLAKLLSKPLGVSVGSLEKLWGDSSEDAPVNTLVADLEPWEEPVDGESCAQAICEVIRRHVYLRDEETWALTCWIFLCAMMDHVTILPIAGITSPIKRCGKTNLLGVLRRLCRKALSASAISSAGVYRVVTLCKPSLLIDEADTFLAENEQLRGLLNSGHTVENAFKILVNPDTLEPERFSTFCPKAIALIGELPNTLTDRAIQVKMVRKPKGIKTIVVRKVPLEAYFPVARQIRRWAEDNWEAVQIAEAKLPPGLNDRAAENWEVLAQIATVLGGEWQGRIFKAATLISGEDDSEAQLLGVYLLYSLRSIFKAKECDLAANKMQTLGSDMICEELNKDTQAPWADWGRGDKKGITQKKLGVELRKFQVKSHQESTGTRVRGYRWCDLEGVFKRYLDDDPNPPGSSPPDSSSPSDATDPESEKTQASPPEVETEDTDFQNTDSPDRFGMCDKDPAGPQSGGVPIGPPGPETERDAPMPQKTALTRSPEDKSHSHNDLTPNGLKIQSVRGTDQKSDPFEVKSHNASYLQTDERVERNIGGTERVSPLFSTDPESGDAQGNPHESGIGATSSQNVGSPDRFGTRVEDGVPPPFSIISTPEELNQYVNALPGDLERIALDLETFVPDREAEIKKSKRRKETALDWQVARIRLISLTIPEGDPVVIDLGPQEQGDSPMRSAVWPLLERLKDVEIVGHRLGFDLCFLEHEFGWRPSRVWDTWIAAELLLNDDWELCDKSLRPKKISPGPAALGNVLATWAGITIDKELGGGALSDFGAFPLCFAQYAYSAGDTRYLPILIPKIQEALMQAGMEKIALIEMALVPVLSHMEIVGIPLRADILEAELVTLYTQRSTLDSEIESALRAAGFDPTLDYSKKSKTYLQPSKKSGPTNINGTNLKIAYFERVEQRRHLQLPRTLKGNMSLSADALTGLDDPVSGLYTERAKVDALIIGIKQRLPFISPDGRVHPVHLQLSANTGRISTEGPPMSNVPKAERGSPLRRGVEAPEGYVLIQGDLGLIEVRAQAHFTKDPTMVELFNLPSTDPRNDIYRLMASWIAKVPIEQIAPKGAERNQAKPVVLGTAYLQGLDGFIQYAKGYGVEFTPARAEQLRSLYFQHFPGIKKWQDEAWANADKITEGRSQLGRRRMVLPIAGDHNRRYRQVQAQVNYIIQSACADGLKIGLIKIAAQLPSGAELIHSIHDEVLVLCPITLAQEAKEIVTRCMLEAYAKAFGEPLKVPIVFEVKILQNWGEKK